ncbi:MAG: copper chaperone PCu(A)C, partial [Rhodospirillales bacterium]|nr:copper chaperone PCu(A)C [Rhodospirillales bacterium]
MTGMRMAALALGLLSASGPAWAADLDITRAWARLPAGAPNGAAFMTIVNKGPADRLTGAKADLARTVELHTHVQEGDIMRMRPVPAIDVPAGQTVTMKPGGLHVML